MVGVVALVADQFARRCDSRDQHRGGGDVGDIAAGQQDRVRSALLVAERVDPGGAPAARAADRLMAGIAFTPFSRRQPTDAPSPQNCRSS
jgi:hypothetical protein